MDALIGYSGLVGSHLSEQKHFGAKFNSSNVSDILKNSYDEVFCAAAPGSMLAANTSPDMDRTQICDLIELVTHLKARKFILISTTAVFDSFSGRYAETDKNYQEKLAYGRHRRMLEQFIEDRFDNFLIVRLPALFGKRLRKNFLFDLMNPVPSFLSVERLVDAVANLSVADSALVKSFYQYDASLNLMKLDRVGLNVSNERAHVEEIAELHNFSSIHFHNPKSTYQFYNLNRIERDIRCALDEGLNHIHLVNEPLKTSEIYSHLIKKDMPKTNAKVHLEDMITNHASLWDRSNSYLESSATILAELSDFFNNEKL